MKPLAPFNLDLSSQKSIHALRVNVRHGVYMPKVGNGVRWNTEIRASWNINEVKNSIIRDLKRKDK